MKSSIPIEMPFNTVGFSFECALQPPVHHLKAQKQSSTPIADDDSRVPVRPNGLSRSEEAELIDFNFTLTDLFRSRSVLRNMITRKQKMCGPGPTWQHRQLYRPRYYVSGDSQYYAKMTTHFNDSWCPILPVLDLDGAGFCAHMLSPFTMEIAKIGPQQFSEFLKDNAYETGLAIALGRRYAADLGVCEDSSLTRASTALSYALGSVTSETGDLNSSQCDEGVESRLRLTPLEIARKTYYENGHLLSSFFGLSTEGHSCRLNFIPKLRPFAVSNRDDFMELNDVCGRPKWLEQVCVAVHREEVFGLAGKMRLPSELGSQAQQIILLFGGKDMLALDWLPTVSRMFHHFATSASNEHSQRQARVEGLRRSRLNRAASSTRTPTDQSRSYQFNTSVLMFEYPGYGFSVGTSTPATFREQTLNVIDRLIKSFTDGQFSVEISVIGFSLGSGMAIEAAKYILESYVTRIDLAMFETRTQIKLGELVLIATPTNVVDCATQLVSFCRLLEPLIGKIVNTLDRTDLAWDNTLGLTEFTQSVLQNLGAKPHPRIFFLHGAEDNFVRPDMSRQLHRLVREMIEQHYDIARGRHELTAPITAFLNDLSYKLLPAASHWSIIGDHINLESVFQLIFKSSCVQS